MEFANEAVRQARFTGDREQLLGARVRHAQVWQFLGKLDEAITELTGCVDEARVHEWTALEAFAVQNRGKTYFDAKDYENALADVSHAVSLREKLGASPSDIESSLIAVAVVQSFVDETAGRPSADGADGEAAPENESLGATGRADVEATGGIAGR